MCSLKVKTQGCSVYTNSWEVKEMDVDFQKRLEDRICEDYQFLWENSRTIALEIRKKCPHHLLPNVEQWVRGEQITDIYAGKYSIPMIMEIWGRKDFLGALYTMIEYLTGDSDTAERRIWQMRR